MKSLNDKQLGGGGEDVVLQTLKNFPCLRDVAMRPTFGANTRRTVGTLEAHTNGFRFSMKGGREKIDILYSWIKLAIFEPCESNSLIVLLHFHFHQPLMVAKKRTQDVQFFTEVAQLTEDLSMRRLSSAHDPDEILEEEREREMKVRLNKIFKEFSQKTQDLDGCPLEFDVPYPDMSFLGVPYRSSVTLCPCAKTLVSLQDWPPFVLELASVDVVVFERS